MNTGNEADAYLLLADISGYTGFLRANAVTLAHANYIVSELLAAVIGRAEAPVRPNKLEGDAVLFAAPAQAVAGVRRSMFGFFAAFYARRAALIACNTCPCEACTTIDRLDLKVIGHFGRVLRYRIGKFDELAGVDVILAHRLLKNTVAARRYLLVSEAAWRNLAPEPPPPVVRQVEDCEGVGAVPVVVCARDLPEVDVVAPPPSGPIARLRDFAIKHLILLPFGKLLTRLPARRALAAACR